MKEIIAKPQHLVVRALTEIPVWTLAYQLETSQMEIVAVLALQIIKDRIVKPQLLAQMEPIPLPVKTAVAQQELLWITTADVPV